MFLLVIGLVAVIIAILVAAFLTLRRRPADDDEEADSRLSVRDRARGRGRDEGWDTTPRRPGGRTMTGGRPVVSRRPGPDPRGSRRSGGDYEAADYDQDRGYEPTAHGYGERSPLGGYEPERVPSARRGGRHPEGTAPAARGGPAMDYGMGPAAALYDTGPRAAADLAATQINADLALADSDVFPRVRADIPRPAGKPGKPGKQRNQPKGRGKASRKHDDDEGDWPSTEWDKLSDVEYWAELSADKPLATTARTAQSAAPAQPAAAAARPARSAARRPATLQEPVEFPDDTGGGARPAPRRPPAPARRPDSPPEGPERSDARPRNTRPPASREPSPQRQDIQPVGAQHTDPHAADPAARTERFTAWREQPDVTGPIPVRDRPRRPAAYPDEDPLTSPSFSRVSTPAEDSRSYRPASRGRPVSGGSQAGGYPRSPSTDGYPSGPAQPDGYPDPASGRRDYPAPVTPAGYPSLGDRTDPHGLPTDPHGPPTDPHALSTDPHGLRTGPHGPPTDPHGPRTDPHGLRTGPHSVRPAASRPAGDGRPAEAPAPQQAAASNPYGSFVDSAPPPRPAGHGRNGTGSGSTGPATTGPQYPPAQPLPSGNYPGYGTGSATAYPDPYGPPSGGYPAASAGPQQGNGWYAAPPVPTAAQPPGEYPYPGTRSGYPGSNDYLAQPSPAGYGSTYGNGSYGGQYSGGHHGDPYGRDDYGGYHPGQG